MLIKTYKNSAEVNRVNKNDYLRPVYEITGTLRNECSILRPSIDFELNEPPIFNYAYIPDFGRYYFVSSITAVNNKLWRIEFNVDVLMSYKDAIYNLQGIIARQENEYNPLLVDSEILTQNNTDTRYMEFSNYPFNTTRTGEGIHNILLNVVGA